MFFLLKASLKHEHELVNIVCEFPCPGPITLRLTGAAAKEWPLDQGEYHLTDQEHNGAPVYRNSHGRYLYTYGDGTWRADYEIGTSGYIRSVETGAACPAAVSQWHWLYRGKWKSGDIAATCKANHIQSHRNNS